MKRTLKNIKHFREQVVLENKFSLMNQKSNIPSGEVASINDELHTVADKLNPHNGKKDSKMFRRF